MADTEGRAHYGGGGYGLISSGGGGYGASSRFTSSFNVVGGPAAAVQVASSVTADSNSHASPTSNQHPSTMSDARK